MSKNTKFGVLYIVATPIGNLEDISKRALNCLSSVDFCAAEDTRKSKILMNKYNITTRLVSYHNFSEKQKLKYLISNLKDGLNIALISDAGTPLISDPGYLLVKAAQEESIQVIPIPGPSSLISALSISGFPSDKFIFYGFPPKQQKAKQSFMKSLVSENRTSIVFESKRRIKDFLVDLEGLCPGRKVFIAREMTKLHETFYRGEINKVISEISLDENSLKGEFVIVVEGIKEVKKEILLTNDQAKVLEIILEKMKKKEALSLASKVFGIKKNSLYKFILEQK
tara:strand:+ start:496 stop:1344 length:849 start_codon:yes stop_codon:yes gene_type:complete